jgi:thiol:disulfide interchange protein DsbD
VAAGVAAAGVLAGALSGSFHATWPRRLAKGAGVALLVGGIVYAAGAAAARERARQAEGFTWLKSYPEAIALARAEGRPVIIDFWAEWCVACKELDRIAWADPRVRAEASRFVAVKVDGTDGSPTFEEVSAAYDIAGMPTVIFLDAHGREVPERVVGAIDAGEMIEKLGSVDRACEKPVPVATSGALACATRW